MHHHWVAASNYSIEFATTQVFERVIFPSGPAESWGMRTPAS
jgi:hypothetical protein